MYDYEQGFFTVLENMDVCKQMLKENKFRTDVRGFSSVIHAKKQEKNKKKFFRKALYNEIIRLQKSVANLKISQLKEQNPELLEQSINQYQQKIENNQEQIDILTTEIDILDIEIHEQKISLKDVKENFDDFRPGEIIWDHLNQSQIGNTVGRTIGLPGTYAGNKIQSIVISEFLKRKENVNSHLQKKLDDMQQSSNHSKKLFGYLGEYLKNVFF